MKVQGLHQGCRGMKGGDFAGGDLPEGVDMAVGPSRASHRHGVIENFLKGRFEC